MDNLQSRIAVLREKHGNLDHGDSESDLDSEAGQVYHITPKTCADGVYELSRGDAEPSGEEPCLL